MIYLIICDRWEDRDNEIVTICSNEKVAKDLMYQYEQNCKDNDGCLTYHISEIDPNIDEDILWDCEIEAENIYG